jgi:hypothetical protein
MPRRRTIRRATRRARRTVKKVRARAGKSRIGGRSIKNYVIGGLGLSVIRGIPAVQNLSNTIPAPYRSSAIITGSGLAMSYAGFGQKDLVSAGIKLGLANFAGNGGITGILGTRAGRAGNGVVRNLTP